MSTDNTKRTRTPRVLSTDKTCKQCKQTLNKAEHFYRGGNNSYQTRCKPCHQIYVMSLPSRRPNTGGKPFLTYKQEIIDYINADDKPPQELQLDLMSKYNVSKRTTQNWIVLVRNPDKPKRTRIVSPDKTCKDCKQTLNKAEHFYKAGWNSYQARCKPCQKMYVTTRRKTAVEEAKSD